MTHPGGMSSDYSTRKGLAGFKHGWKTSWKRHPRRNGLGILLLVLLVIWALWWLFFRDPAPKQAQAPQATTASSAPAVAATPTPASASVPAALPPAPPAKAAPAHEPQVQPAAAPSPKAGPRLTPASVPSSQAAPVSELRQTGGPRRWQNFGADKAYPTRAAAIADAPRVMRLKGYPEEVIRILTEKMKQPGSLRRLANGDRLGWMRSGPSTIWNDVLVDFRNPPTPGMGYYADAEEWSVEYDGVTWLIGIPKVCNNLYGSNAQLEDCYTITFTHKYPDNGKVRWGIGSTTGPMKTHRCNAQRQGTGAWQRWQSVCHECIPPRGYLQRVLGSAGQWVHAFKYGTTHRTQTLRFSSEVLSKTVYICLENAAGVQTCGVYTRPEDWRGRRHITVDDSLWRPDNNDCPR